MLEGPTSDVCTQICRCGGGKAEDAGPVGEPMAGKLPLVSLEEGT